MAQDVRQTGTRSNGQFDQYQDPQYRSRSTQQQASGWTVFSAFMLGIAGVMGMMNGLVALIHDEAYLVTEEQVVTFDFTTWGWIHLIGGAVVLAAAFGLTTGSVLARVIGVLAASLHALAQIAFIEAYPFWALTIIALDVLVIYGCLVHGNDRYGSY